MHARIRTLAVGASCALVLAFGASPAGSDEHDHEGEPGDTVVASVTGYAGGAFADIYLAPEDEEDDPIDVVDGPRPEVFLPTNGGGPITDSLAAWIVSYEGESQELAGPIEVSTEGALGVDGWVASTATVTSPNFVEAGADLVEVECGADLDGASGSTTITNGNGVEGPLPTNPDPNTVIPFSDSFPVGGGVIDVSIDYTLNAQTVENGTITVIGVQVDVLQTFTPAGGAPEVGQDITLIYGITSCGVSPDVIPAAEAVRVAPRFTG